MLLHASEGVRGMSNGNVEAAIEDAWDILRLTKVRWWSVEAVAQYAAPGSHNKLCSPKTQAEAEKGIQDGGTHNL
jgi:hypothetical protein